MSELCPNRFALKRWRFEWSVCEAQIKRQWVYYYIVTTLLTPINVSPIREDGGETGDLMRGDELGVEAECLCFSWRLMKHRGQKAPNSIRRVNASFGCTRRVSANVFTQPSALGPWPAGLHTGYGAFRIKQIFFGTGFVCCQFTCYNQSPVQKRMMNDFSGWFHAKNEDSEYCIQCFCCLHLYTTAAENILLLLLHPALPLLLTLPKYMLKIC